MSESERKNPLASLQISKLLLKFAIPSIIAMLTSSLYNIVDQYFIGNSVGALGNAATNVAFPLTTMCIAIALLNGIGGASAFNLARGGGKNEDAKYYMGNAITSLLIMGVILAIFTEIFLAPLVRFMGAPASVEGYAQEYIRITAIGFPMLILTSGGAHLVRADGSPMYSMFCNLAGAITNIILDAIFVFGLGMGMTGAALATIIGQYISAGLVVRYLRHCKSVTLERKHLKIKKKYITHVMALGSGPCSNQLAMTVVQLVMNNSLTYYGGLSSYGKEIPLACAGIISKVNMVFMSFVVGISQGMQPIISFNYGAKNYDRVKGTYRLAVTAAEILAVIAFVIFQTMPEQIIRIFGQESAEYVDFAVRYFRIFLFFTFLNGIQPISSTFFTAIGKPKRGMFLSLTRQIIFLLPLIVLLPLFMGIDGILYAGPAADAMAAVVAGVMVYLEFARPEYMGSKV